MAMESPFERKPSGFSNSVSQTMGFPSSGEMQQGARALPPQRQQSPFQHKNLDREKAFSGGPMPRPVTEGQSAQGAQFQMHPTRLSPGLSSYMRSWEGQQANAFNQMGIDSRMAALEQAQKTMQQQQAAQRGPMTVSMRQPSFALPQGSPQPPPQQPAAPQGVPGQPAPSQPTPQYAGPEVAYGGQPAPSPFAAGQPTAVDPGASAAMPTGDREVVEATETGLPTSLPGRETVGELLAPEDYYAKGQAQAQMEQGQYTGPAQAQMEMGRYTKGDVGAKSGATEGTFGKSLPENMDPALKKLAIGQEKRIKELESMFDEGAVYDAKAVAALNAKISKQQQAIEMKHAEAGLGTSASSAAMAQHDLEAMKALVSQKSDLAILQLKAKEHTIGQLAGLYGQLNNTQMQQKALELQEKAQKSLSIHRILDQANKWGTKIGGPEFNALLAKALVEAGIDPNDPLVKKVMKPWQDIQSGKSQGTGDEEEEKGADKSIGESAGYKQKKNGLEWHLGGAWTDDTALLNLLEKMTDEEKAYMKEYEMDLLQKIWGKVENEPQDEAKWFEIMGWGYIPDDKDPVKRGAKSAQPSF